MTQEKKQTAVEWLIHQLRLEGFIQNGDDLILIEHKALAMQREQIEEAFKHGNLPTFMGELLTADNYYERTYGKEAGHE